MSLIVKDLKKYKVSKLIDRFLLKFIVLLLLRVMVYLLCLRIASVLGRVREWVSWDGWGSECPGTGEGVSVPERVREWVSRDGWGSECPGTGEGVSVPGRVREWVSRDGWGSECPGTGEGVSGSWWSYSKRTSNSRERDRGEKSTGEQGETDFFSWENA